MNKPYNNKRINTIIPYSPRRIFYYGLPEYPKTQLRAIHHRHDQPWRAKPKKFYREKSQRERWLAKHGILRIDEKTGKKELVVGNYTLPAARPRGTSIQINAQDVPTLLDGYDGSATDYSTQSKSPSSREEPKTHHIPVLPQDYAFLCLLGLGRESEEQAHKLFTQMDVDGQRQVYQLLLRKGAETQLYQLVSSTARNNPQKVYEAIDGMSEKEQTRVYGAMLRMGRQGRNTIDKIFGLQALPRKPNGIMSVDEVTIVDDETDRFQSRQVLNGNFRDYKNDPFKGSHVDEHWISNEKTISRILL